MNQKQKKIFIWVGLTALTFAFFSFLSGFWYALTLMLMIGLHECGHLLAAKRVGVKTAGFYFIPLGGVALIKENPSDQWKKFIIAYGGPLVGLILCVLAVGVWLSCRFNIFNITPETQHLINNLSLNAIFIWSVINIFNLLPIYPFDGGRLLAAIHINRKNGFEKYLLYISWIFLGVAFIFTGSVIIIFIGIMFYKMIGRLEPNYFVHKPFNGKNIFFGWLLYLGLIIAFIACLLVTDYI